MEWNRENAYLFCLAVENMGIEFYRHVIETTTDSAVREELGFLLKEEERHRDFFCSRGGLDQPCDAQEPESRERRREAHWEIVAPLKAALEEGTLASPAEALRLGAAFEKRSIRFFEEILELVRGEADEKVLQSIISEERRHLQKINLLLE